MNRFLLAILLCSIGVSYVSSTRAADPAGSRLERFVEARAKAVAEWSAAPYLVEPPDVLATEISWNEFNGVIPDHRHPAASPLRDTANLSMEGLIRFEQNDSGAHIRAGRLQLEGRYLVFPDGTIKIAGLPPIDVVGKTLDEARQAVANALSDLGKSVDVKLDVAQSNSKVVYVIERSKAGDSVVRLPHSGQLSVLDALAHAGMETENLETVGLAPTERQPDETVPIDLEVLRSPANKAANLPLLPGDRLFVTTKSDR